MEICTQCWSSKAKAGVTTMKKMSKTAERFVEDENYFHRDSNGTLIWYVLLHKRILAKYVDLLPINCVSTWSKFGVHKEDWNMEAWNIEHLSNQPFQFSVPIRKMAAKPWTFQHEKYSRRQGCIICSILPSGMGACGEHGDVLLFSNF